MGKKWWILICIFSILTFTSSIITSVLLFNIENHRNEIKTNNLKGTKKIYQNTLITYYGDNDLHLTNLLPGNRIERSFSITNNNSESIEYNIAWENVSTSWDEGNENFIYTLTCDDFTLTSITMPNSDNIIKNGIINSNKTNNCILTIETLQNEFNFENSFDATYTINLNDGGVSNEE